MASDKELNIGIKVTANTSGAKEAEKAIDGLTQAIEEQAVAEKELVTETEKVVVEEKKLVEVEKEVEKVVEKTTAAKKKKVVEEKKEVAAVEELVVAEKKAIDTTGMYIDAKGRVHEASGKFVKVEEKEREGLKERIRLQEKATVTTTGAANATKELGKSGNNGAMGLLALSNAIQDVQYGFGGMVNNIPQIVTGLGMGMGVAGAVQIAAVGFQFLLKNVDLFGEKAKEAARNAADLASDAMADADAAYKVAEATKAATESQDRHNEAMQAAEERYKEQIRLSEELIKQKQAERDAEIALADAQAAFEMAQIQLAEGRGEISKEDAIIARNKVRTEADARKQTAAIALEEAKVAEARKKAAAEEAQAKEKRGMALQLTGEGQGMLTKEDRALAEANKKSAQDQLESSKLRREALAETITQEQRAASSQLADMGIVDKREMLKRLAENREKLAKETEEAAKLQADINREDQKLKKDKEARIKTGIKDGDRRDLDKAVQAQFSEARAAEMRAAGFIGEAATGESGIAQSQRLFGMRQATGAMQAQAQIETERRAKQEEERRAQEKAAAEEAKAKEKEQREREKEWAEVKPAGRKLATSLKGSGVNESFISELESAADESAESFDGMSKLYRLIQKLTSNTSKLTAQAKADLERLEAEIDDLKLAK